MKQKGKEGESNGGVYFILGAWGQTKVACPGGPSGLVGKRMR